MINNSRIPEENIKDPSWPRILDIVLRTLHVAVTSVLFGGAVCGISINRLFTWNHFAIATGCALIASEIYYRRQWPHEGRGIMVYIHVGLFALINLLPNLLVPLLLGALIFGIVGSHMPKKFRHWSFIHGPWTR